MPASPTTGNSWLKEKDDGVTITLAVQPGAKTTEVVGLHGGALKVKVASPPVDGAANEALLDFLASALGRPRRAAELLRGAGSRQKVVLIRGVTLDEARARLAPR